MKERPVGRVLVTGGAGFIGSYVVEALIERGYTVRVFDNLEPQVHGSNAEWPEDRGSKIEDRDRPLRSSILNPQAVPHWSW